MKMSSKTDQDVNASQGGDRRSRAVVLVLMGESDLPVKQLSLNDATARKLLSVVAIELAFVFLVTSGFFFNKTDDICSFVKSHAWISLIALIAWAVILVIYMFRGAGGGSGPLQSVGNVVVFALTTLCLTVISVFLTICSDKEIIIQALGGTLGLLLLVIVVAVLTPLDTTGWGKQLWIMTIVLVLAELFIHLAWAFLPVNEELQNRIFLIQGIIDVILSYFYILHYLQTIVGGEMDKEDGWFNACVMLFWIFNAFVMLFLLSGLM